MSNVTNDFLAEGPFGSVLLRAGRNCKDAQLLIDGQSVSFGEQIDRVYKLNQEYTYEVTRTGYQSVIGKFTLTEETPLFEQTINLVLNKYSINFDVKNGEGEPIETVIKVNNTVWDASKTYNHGAIVSVVIETEGYKKFSKSYTINEEQTIEIVLEREIVESRSITVETHVEDWEFEPRIFINGTETNTISETALNGATTLNVVVELTGFERFEQTFEINESLFESPIIIDNLQKKLYRVEFFTTPEECSCFIERQTEDGKIDVSAHSKVFEGYYGDVIHCGFCHNTGYYENKYVMHTIVGDEQVPVKVDYSRTKLTTTADDLEAVKTVVVTVQIKHPLESKPTILTGKIGDEFMVPVLSHVIASASEPGYNTVTKEWKGILFGDDLNLHVENHRQLTLRVTYPHERFVPLLFKANIQGVDGTYTEKELFYNEPIKVPYNAEVTINLGSNVIHQFKSIPFRVTEDTVFDITEDMIAFIVKEKPKVFYKLTIEQVYLWHFDPGYHKGIRVVNGLEVDDYNTHLMLEEGTEVNFKCIYKDYIPYEKSFVMDSDKIVTTEELETNMKMVPWKFTIDVTPAPDTVVVSNPDVELTQEGDLYVFFGRPYALHDLKVEKAGYMPINTTIKISSSEAGYKNTMTEVPKPVEKEEKPVEKRPLIDVYDDEMKEKFFKNMKILIERRQYYRHLRIGQAFKNRVVNEETCRTFFESGFARFLQIRADYTIYRHLHQYYLGID